MLMLWITGLNTVLYAIRTVLNIMNLLDKGARTTEYAIWTAAWMVLFIVAIVKYRKEANSGGSENFRAGMTKQAHKLLCGGKLPQSACADSSLGEGAFWGQPPRLPL